MSSTKPAGAAVEGERGGEGIGEDGGEGIGEDGGEGIGEDGGEDGSKGRECSGEVKCAGEECDSGTGVMTLSLTSGSGDSEGGVCCGSSGRMGLSS